MSFITAILNGASALAPLALASVAIGFVIALCFLGSAWIVNKAIDALYGRQPPAPPPHAGSRLTTHEANGLTFIFYPGNGAAEHQILAYVGTQGRADVTPGTAAHSTPLIPRDSPAVALAPYDTAPVAPWLNTLLNWLPCPCLQFRGVRYRWIAVDKMNVAQRPDVEHALIETLAVMRAAPPAQRFVLFGVSRGAAVALQVAHLLPRVMAARVQGVVAEGVFAVLDEMVAYRFGGWAWLARLSMRWCTAIYDKASRDGWLTPEQTAARFQHPDMPILVVTSLADRVVPTEQSQRVYRALIHEAYCTRARLVKLTLSPHSDYATAFPPDMDTYRDALDDMYRGTRQHTLVLH